MFATISEDGTYMTMKAGPADSRRNKGDRTQAAGGPAGYAVARLHADKVVGVYGYIHPRSRELLVLAQVVFSDHDVNHCESIHVGDDSCAGQHAVDDDPRFY
jgi:hypothetical protein